MTILAPVRALITPIHPAEHVLPSSLVVDVDDDLLAVATAMGVVRDLTASTAARVGARVGAGVAVLSSSTAVVVGLGLLAQWAR